MSSKTFHNAERDGDDATAPIVPPVANVAALLRDAEFIRLPKPKERCLLTGLSRTTINELIESGAVRATKLRKKGSQRGITLIHRESLIQFLNSMATGADDESGKSGVTAKENRPPRRTENERLWQASE